MPGSGPRRGPLRRSWKSGWFNSCRASSRASRHTIAKERNLTLHTKVNQVLSVFKNIEVLRAVRRREIEIRTYLGLFAGTSRSPATKFVIFAQGRTGSDLLRSFLNSNPEIHCDPEILGHRVLFPMAFIRGRCALSPKNVYGLKVKIYQLTQDQQIRDPKQFMSDLYEQGWKMIYLKRRNLLRQAISGFVLAHRKKPTHRITEGALRLGEIYVDCDELVSKIKERETYMVKEEEVLEGLPHMPVTYEDDLLRAENHQDTLDSIFDYLGVPSAPVKTDLAKITPAQLSDFVQNHEEVMRFISKTEYAKFLADQ